ncbi:hypothetical protein A9Q79_05700 [Methylophaga sp. 42_25_T18]|nr:hypothetical protein A9Q79_05700 [Methylophaga sp. 42_25_T18]
MYKTLIDIADTFFGSFLLAANFLSDKVGFYPSLILALCLFISASYILFKTRKVLIKFVGSLLLTLMSTWFIFCVLLIEGLATRNAI